MRRRRANNLRFAVFGAGFWARYQLCGWRELEGVVCAAICDPIRAKAEKMAQEFGIPAVYDSPEQLLQQERPDFVDVITNVETHGPLVMLAAAHGVPVICQKPMGPSLKVAEQMVAVCREAGVPMFVHENWRWQTPMRQVKRMLSEGHIGTPFRARIDMISGFPVFVNQPFLRELKQFLLTDMGSHLLDAARFLFGEAESLYCQTQRLHPDIKGEDVASVMKMGGKTTVLCEMAYAENPLEREHFPQTFLFVEGERGSLELAPDYWVRVTTADGTFAHRYPPPRYAWVDPAYEIGQASVVACNANLLQALRGVGPAETTGEDNLKTVRLIFAAYDSARQNKVIRL